MSSKKVLHITFDMAIGGTEQVIRQLVENTDPKQFTPSIICIDGNIGALGQQLQQNIKINYLTRQTGFDWQLIIQLRKHIKEQNIDIVHCHQYSPYIYGLFSAIGTGTAVIFTEHGRFYPDTYKWKRYLINPILSLFTDHIISISEATKEALVRYENFPKRKIRVIYNGLHKNDKQELCTDQIKEDLNLKDDTIIFGTISRLDPIKNQKMMISAFQLAKGKCPNIKLLIVGDGPMRLELETHAKNIGVDGDVIFTGFITNPQSYFKLIDIFLLSSLSEGTSMTILEAMAFSKPCIVTDAGGNPELVINKETGLVTKNNDSMGFSEAISSLARDAKKRKSLGHNGKSRFLKLFTEQHMVNAYQSTYREAI